MGRTVDYYLAPQSPWAYLGHQRLADIVQRTGATVRVMPIDLGGKVFPISGGLPLGQRAPQRQAYRLVELQRFSQHLNVPLTLKPRYFPVGGDDSARLIIAADLALGGASAFDKRHQAGLANAGVNFVHTAHFQCLMHPFGRIQLFKPQFRVGMEIAPKGSDLGMER